MPHTTTAAPTKRLHEPPFIFALDSSIHAVFEDQAEMKSINRFFEARLVACGGAQSHGGIWGLMRSTPSTGASEEEPFPCSHPRCRAACFSPSSPSP